MTYYQVETVEKDFADLKEHGVEFVSITAWDIDEAKEKLRIARKYGMNYHLEDLPDITENVGLVKETGYEPVDALMIGGVYQGND